MNKHSFKKICFLLFFLSAALFAMSQGRIPNNMFIGKWISRGGTGTGYEITTHSIRRIQMQPDSTWQSAPASHEYLFFDTTIKPFIGIYEVIAYADYTSQRLYLTDGTESSIETTEFCAYRFDLLPGDILKLSVSKPHIFNTQNQRPVVTRSEINKLTFKYPRADRTIAVYLKRYVQ